MSAPITYTWETIIPIVYVDGDLSKLGNKRLLGTAFFIGPEKYLLTAKHVAITAQELGSCYVARPDTNDRSKTQFSRVEFELHDAEIDVAICKSNFIGKKWLKINDLKYKQLQNIHAIGYPETACSVSAGMQNFSDRAHRGHILRGVAPEEARQLTPNNCTLIEVNFPISRGLSGAPLFSHTEASIYDLVGVCIGNSKSEFLDYQHKEVADDGATHTESVVEVERYGLAIPITEFGDWRPRVLGGKSVFEALAND